MKEVWPIDHPRAQAISTAIGEMMALDYQPFSLVQDESFKRLMTPKYVLPSRRYFAETVITDMYELEGRRSPRFLVRVSGADDRRVVS